MVKPQATLEQRLREAMAGFTPSERLLGGVLLEHYPISGLGTVTELAEAAGVSTPTVIRMARKLGFDGFSDLQRALRDEVADRIRAPMAKKSAWGAAPEDGHILGRFAEAVASNVHHTLHRLDQKDFDDTAGLLADATRPVFIAGGRITRSLADYLFNHLQIIRPRVTHLSQSSNVWPQYLVDMDPSAVLVLFDIRRYESDLLKLARLAQERGAAIVLLTDQWGSPVGRHADHQFNALIEVPSSWDSTIALMVILEALIAQVQEMRWDDSRARIEELEGMFTQTRLFRDFT